MSFNGASQRIYTAFTTSITGLQMLGTQSQQTYTLYDSAKPRRKDAHCAMVQGVGLEPTNFQIISLGPYQLGHPCM